MELCWLSRDYVVLVVLQKFQKVAMSGKGRRSPRK